MQTCAATTALALALLAARYTAAVVDVCSLPVSALYVADGNALVACAASGSPAISDVCHTACSCRRLEKAQNVYGVCLNTSEAFDCGAVENAASCERASTPPSAVAIMRELASDNGDGLEAWQWVLIGLAIAVVVGLLIFVVNWFKNRPLRGDNRREVVQQSLELSRSQPKDAVSLLPTATRESQARTATTNRESAARSTTRSHDTNPSQISGLSGASYHTYAGNPMSSTLTDTEIATQHQERAFSPISSDSARSHSVRSSDYSQGVDTTTTPNTTLLGPNRADSSDSDSQAYPSFSSFSISSDMDSFSSQLTVEGGSDIETGERPRKKSIEF